MQDHLELRAQREQRLPEVTDAGQVARGAVETGHTRALTTVFGDVKVNAWPTAAAATPTCIPPTRR